MTVYARQIAQAKKLIKAKGQLVTWVKHTAVPNPTQPWKTSNVIPTPATYPVSIVFLSPKEKDVLLLTATEVPTGAPKGLMAAVDFTPEINDSVLRGADTFVVKDFSILSPNGETILYKIDFA